MGAGAWVVGREDLRRLADVAARRGKEAFWQELLRDPEGALPGAAMDEALDFLEERGIHAVASEPEGDAKRLADLGLAACLDADDAQALAGAIEELEPADMPEGLRGALELLRRAASRVGSPSLRLLLFLD
jgi:hypothetical protein